MISRFVLIASLSLLASSIVLANEVGDDSRINSQNLNRPAVTPTPSSKAVVPGSATDSKVTNSQNVDKKVNVKSSSGQLLTDRLILAMLVKHLPEPLHQQANNKWPGGTYSLTVEKAGEPKLFSTFDHVRIQLPITVRIKGNISNALLKIEMACTSQFSTVSEVELRPESLNDLSTLKSRIELPIPPAIANCEGISFPIDDSLKMVVAQKKVEWEAQLDHEIKHWFRY